MHQLLLLSSRFGAPVALVAIVLYPPALAATETAGVEIRADVNRRDGLVDRIVAVDGPDGAALEVFEAAGDQGVVAPERIALPTPATSLAAGRFDDDVFVDLVAACGDTLVVVFGRDRRLTFSDRAETVPPPEVTELPLDSATLESLAKRRIDLDPDRPVHGESPASAFVVDIPGDFPDASPGDGACVSTGGACTLRAAIEEANVLAGADTIAFSLGAGTPTISPAAALPSILEAVTIDGATGGATRIEIEGSAAGAGAHGIRIASSAVGVSLSGLVINRFGGDGIRIEGADNSVTGCYVGTDSAGGGSVAGNGGAGIYITGEAATGNTIGGLTSTPGVSPGNVVAGNTGVVDSYPFDSEILLRDGARGNVIQGNLIGLDAAGTSVLGNGRIYLLGTLSPPSTENNTIGGPSTTARNVFRALNSAGFASTSSNLVQGNFVGTDVTGAIALGGACLRADVGGAVTIGGNAPIAGDPPGNVIAGCDDAGVTSIGNWDGFQNSVALVRGNLIGLAADGVSPLPNTGPGVRAPNAVARVGGAVAGDGNVISGNEGRGVEISLDFTLVGNRIGLDRSGSQVVPNQGDGVLVGNAEFVSGSGTIAGNMISGNAGDGIEAAPFGGTVTVVGNRIGVLADGTTPAGNAGHGIVGFATVGGTSGLVPGTCQGPCNVVANNAGAGVWTGGTTLGNSIHDNGGLGIDRESLGVTPNVPTNSPGAPYNFPVITSVDIQGADTVVAGSLNAAGSSTYRIEVFSSSAADPSGHGEGAVFRGTTSCLTSQSGGCTWDVVASGTAPVWTATATHEPAFGFGSTSEFSRAYDPAADLDGDGVINANDNCFEASNPLQEDGEADGAGDVCDNCVSTFNSGQRDEDGDGLGDVCDNCPGAPNAAQADADLDGRGDACDCQSLDPSDRTPPEVVNVQVAKGAFDAAVFSWAPVAAADAYSVSRFSDLYQLALGYYGECSAEGVTGTTWTDTRIPVPGIGVAYLVQAENDDCGLGSLGLDSAERERVNNSLSECVGRAHVDAQASSEAAVSGTVSGTYIETQASDNSYESITELATGGSPSTRISFLEHRWTFFLPSVNRKWIHVEGFRTSSSDGEDFEFAYSTDGVTFTPIPLPSLPFADPQTDLEVELPQSLAGNVVFRVMDTDRTPGNFTQDTVALDEIFVRVLP